VVAIASGSPSALRNRETYTCTVRVASAGASSPHNDSASRSALTGSFGHNSNTASTARGLIGPKASAPRSPWTSSGPRIRNSIALPADATPSGLGVKARVAFLQQPCKRTGGWFSVS
jgi:hypothetical protein